MAMQTGVTVSKVILLGTAGSILVRNGKVSDILGGLQGMVKSFEKSEETGAVADADADLSEALVSQVRRLSTEVHQLASAHPVILNGNSNQTGVMPFLVPATAIGALGYGYMWLKGMSVSDLLYVTKKNMANAVASMSKHLEQVSAALAATKKHLAKRIENLDLKLGEQKEISNEIRKEVGDANKLIQNLSMDLGSIQKLVSHMDDKANSMMDKQNLALTGVMYLCRSVEGKGGKAPDFLQDIAPKNSPSGKKFLDHFDCGCLKGLQHIVEETEMYNVLSAREVSLPRTTSI